MEELIKLLTTGGMGGIDLGAILLLFRECRFYLTATPKEGDYVSLSKQKRAQRMEEDRKCWRDLGRKYLYLILPIVVISLVMVGIVVILGGLRGTPVHFPPGT